MGYVIAAYTLVIGSLVAYGLWLQWQRRTLVRRAARREGGAPDA